MKKGGLFEKSIRYRLISGMLFVVLVALPLASFNIFPVSAADNLVPNPSLEATGPDGLPVSWIKWTSGNNTGTYTYPVAGYNSEKAARVDITKYKKGEKSWIFQNVPVMPGKKYKFSDYYMSNVTTSITIRYLNIYNRYVNVNLGSAGSSPSWKLFSAEFTVPLTMKSLTIMHKLSSVGYLVVDEYSLTDTSEPATPTIAITEPANGATVSGTINISATVTDAATGTVQFFLDSNPIGAPDNTAPYSISYDTKSTTNGLHTIGATLFYGSGGIATATPVIVTVNNVVAPNLIYNPSFEIAGANQLPDGWFKGGYGSNNAVYTYPVAGHNSEKAARVDITSYSNGDAKWYFRDVAVAPGQIYTFTNFYMSNITSNVTLRYLLTNGNYQYVGIGNPPAASNWQQYKTTITVPANVVSLTVFHVIAGVGWLTVDDYSLVAGNTAAFTEGMVSLSFDDSSYSQYQNAFPVMQANGLKGTFYVITSNLLNPSDSWSFHTAEALQMQAAGNEIGSHSRTHPHLTQLSELQLTSEISGSKSDLFGAGIAPANAFAYPYGEYNQTVIQSVKNAGYTNARSVESGFNTKDTDKYVLKTMEVSNVTSPTQVMQWVEQAKTNKTWLVLMFHQIIDNGGTYSTSPANFQAMAVGIKNSGIKVVTVSEGMAFMTP